MKSRVLNAGITVLLVCLAATLVFADDGFLVRKSMSHTAELSVPGYADEAEHAFLKMMRFYVPMPAANGATGDALAASDGKAYPREHSISTETW